jgi:hypothetical protein
MPAAAVLLCLLRAAFSAEPNGKYVPFGIPIAQMGGKGGATPKLPSTLEVLDRADIDARPAVSVSQYKPWVTLIPNTAELLLSYRDDNLMSHTKAGGLVVRRSLQLGAPGSWQPAEYHPELQYDPKAPFKSPDGEWSIHALKDGKTVLLTDGSCSMWRSEDTARTFTNVSGTVGSKLLPAGTFHFNSTCVSVLTSQHAALISVQCSLVWSVLTARAACSDECGSWSVLELDAEEHGMPAGVYYFADQSIWRSADSGSHWRVFSTARNSGDPASAPPIHNFPSSCGIDNRKAFYFQSEVYRRQDGSFLHGTRVPVGQTGDYFDSSQLWQSSDTRGEYWHCISQAAAGYCAAGKVKGGCYTRGGAKDCPAYVDNCANLTWDKAAWIKPGNMYTHLLRLHDGRVLLTWTKRLASIPNPMYDDDGYGAGTRGSISYNDGSSFALDTDYIVIQAQNDSWNPVCRHGGPCRVGFGNTIQLANGTLITVYCRDTPNILPDRTPHNNTQNQILVSVVRWNLPPLKQDDDNAGNDAQRRVLSLAAVAAAAAAAGPHSGAVGAAAAVLDVPPPPAAEQWVVAPCLEATAGGSCLFKAASSSGPRTSWVQLSALPSGCSGSYMAAVAEVQGVE